MDERGDGGFGGFEGGSVAEVAEGLAGDGAYRGQDYVWRQGQVGGFEEVAEVAGCGGAGEGDGVGVVGGIAEELLEDGDGFGGELGAVGFGDGVYYGGINGTGTLDQVAGAALTMLLPLM